MKNRILSVLLALCMVICMVPVTALAAKCIACRSGYTNFISRYHFVSHFYFKGRAVRIIGIDTVSMIYNDQFTKRCFGTGRMILGIYDCTVCHTVNGSSTASGIPSIMSATVGRTTTVPSVTPVSTFDRTGPFSFFYGKIIIDHCLFILGSIGSFYHIRITSFF